MSSVSVKGGMALPFGRIGAALLCALPMQPAQARAVIAACVDQSSPAAMMDERVAQAAAVSQGYGLHVEHFDGQGLGDDAYSPDNFRKLAGGLCQLVLGFPVDAQAPLLPDGLQATNPYAQTGFVLVTRDRPPPAALADLPKGTTVAVTFQTAPNLFLAAHSNLVPAVYTQDARSVDAVASGKVKAAMIWQPSVARYVESHPKAHKLFVQRIDEPHARWNLVALYAPESAAAAAVFDQGVAQLHEAGHLAFLVKPFAVDSTASSGPPPALPLPSRYELPRRNSGQLIKVANAPKAAGGKLPALYTKEQATAGLQSYALNCSFCHGGAMEGRNGPALKGEKFANVKTNFAIGDIFFVLSMQMPAANPGTLPKEEYAALMAYILQQNGYPAGTKKLDYDQALKSTVPLIYSGP